jgi:hypothetical protein
VGDEGQPTDSAEEATVKAPTNADSSHSCSGGLAEALIRAAREELVPLRYPDGLGAVRGV